MKPKTLSELLSDAERAYNRLNVAKADASRRISSADGYEFSAAYRRQENQAARIDYQSARIAALNSLAKIKNKLQDAAEAETPKLSASRLDPNLMNLLQIAGLSEKDFENLAKQYYSPDDQCFTNERAIFGAAAAKGFKLTNIRTSDEKANAIGRYVTALAEVIRHDDTDFDKPLPDPETDFIFESCRNAAKQMLQPMPVESIRCFKATPEAEIINDLNASRNSETDDNSFFEGFTGSRSMESADANDYPALSAIADKLDEIQLPDKKTRIIDGLVSAFATKRLKSSELLSAEEIKEASDRTKGFDESLASELKEIADLFVPDEGLQFSPEPGTKLVKPLPSYDSKVRWRTLQQKALSLNTANEKADDNAASARFIAQRTAELQAKRETEELNRYKSIDRMGKNDGNLHAD